MAQFRKITPCLWFDDQAEEAANLYVSVFPNSRIVQIARYSKAGFEFHGKPEGSVMTVVFELGGHEFTALNGGPEFKFDEAISLQIFCDTQEEVDYFWDKLTADGGAPGPCGWLKDKFGLSWQVTPNAFIEMMGDPDPVKRERVLNAAFRMGKVDIAALRRAYAGE
ncbi:MAG TPA: VOC family protein [Symbiobacteriaceae bacterium]|nr:VOC family protein [Symbiobacteriaceae bacterium]